MTWISVDERLPEDMETVKVCHVSLGIIEANRNGLLPGHWFSDEWGPIPDWRVTHWMPLPDPPDIDQEQ